MPTKRSHSSSVFVLIGTFHDVGNRQGNARLIIEGPFRKSSDAVAILTAMTKDGLYSLADTEVISMRSAEHFRKALGEIRALLKK